MCPNIPGTQASIPSGKVLNTNGQCVNQSGADMCPNISGTQSNIPTGKMLNSNGDCVDAPTTPEVSVFKFIPNIVASGGQCGIELEATLTSSCTITATNGRTYTFPGNTTGVISIPGTQSVLPGKYTLVCTGQGAGAPAVTFNTATCFSELDTREN